MSGAPSNVKAAVGTFLQFANSLKGVIQRSTSLTNFATQCRSGLDEPEVGVGGEGARSLRREALPRLGSQDNDTDHLTGGCRVRKVQVALQHLTAS